MAQESKRDDTLENGQNVKPWFTWDLSVNAKQAKYSNGNKTATAISQCNARGPFWSSGRHIVNVKVVKGGSGNSEIGIGAVDKLFDISPHSGLDTQIFGHFLGEFM
eukprot:44805_1